MCVCTATVAASFSPELTEQPGSSTCQGETEVEAETKADAGAETETETEGETEAEAETEAEREMEAGAGVNITPRLLLEIHQQYTANINGR